MNKSSIIPINKEIIPGKIKANCQLKYFINSPAINAPDPIPTPPKMPLIPSALPFFFRGIDYPSDSNWMINRAR